MKRIGPKMRLAAEYVQAHPGASKLETGRAVWKNWKRPSMTYLYGPVDRAIRVGLIRAEYRGGRYYLTMPE